ncbi:phage portal protein [Metabacillus fastidiosus]|uniref:phage portal protein n=1 Tax=Metabacillus fastidiosus TaxID=1458 RepID=UPI003D28BA02
MAVMTVIPESLAKYTELAQAAAASAEWIVANGPWLRHIIEQHKRWIKEEEIEKFQEAYDGELESIEKREKSRGDDVNHKLHASYAQLVVDTVVDYMLGKPIIWTFEDPLATVDEKIITEYKEELLPLLNEKQSRRVLREQLTQGSVAGYSGVIAWVDEDGQIDYEEFPVQETIPVYDSRGRLKLVIRYYEIEVFEPGNDIAVRKTKVEVYDERYVTYYLSDATGSSYAIDPYEEATGNPIEHKAGRIPVSLFVNGTAARYKKRKERNGTSDLSIVFNLIENYAHVMSDKANTADRLLDQFLLLKNVDLGNPKQAEQNVMMMRKARSLALKNKESDASFIAPEQNDTTIENHLTRVKESIHELTFTPKLSDLSGATATEIKLKYSSLDIKAGKKEIYFISAIEELIKILTDMLNYKRLVEANVKNPYDVIRGKATSNIELYKPEWAQFTINRNLPQNFLEIAQIVSNLVNIVPDIYLYELLWFIEDPVTAIEEMKAQKEEESKRQAQVSLGALGYGGEFSKTDTDEDEDKKEDEE